ncbi:cystathionine gamma-synthase [Sesbania bispinosa]|nr:cystathionine gamma-synthase [Sesbania bispinosa]
MWEGGERKWLCGGNEKEYSHEEGVTCDVRRLLAVVARSGNEDGQLLDRGDGAITSSRDED